MSAPCATRASASWRNGCVTAQRRHAGVRLVPSGERRPGPLVRCARPLTHARAATARGRAMPKSEDKEQRPIRRSTVSLCWVNMEQNWTQTGSPYQLRHGLLFINSHAYSQILCTGFSVLRLCGGGGWAISALTACPRVRRSCWRGVRRLRSATHLRAIRRTAPRARFLSLLPVFGAAKELPLPHAISAKSNLRQRRFLALASSRLAVHVLPGPHTLVGMS